MACVRSDMFKPRAASCKQGKLIFKNKNRWAGIKNDVIAVCVLTCFEYVDDNNRSITLKL